MKRKKMIVIGIPLLLVILLFSIRYELQNKNNEKNDFGISTGEIIEEITYPKTVDVFVKDKQNLIFYSYLIQEKEEEKYQQQFSSQTANFFDYKARENSEGKSGNKLAQNLKDYLEVLTNYYEALETNPNRHPYYGVSIHPKIKKLRVNQQLVDKVIEYKSNGKTFYIWYFKNLDVYSEEIRITFD